MKTRYFQNILDFENNLLKNGINDMIFFVNNKKYIIRNFNISKGFIDMFYDCDDVINIFESVSRKLKIAKLLL